ncbi:MAG: FecR domain-containing protein [Deltaproteobacteria bacterium]|nr:FecR domain-containing protein [Deltaproteobacteria bacterium]
MKRDSKNPYDPNHKALTEAGEWLLRFKEKSITRGTYNRFRSWLAKNPIHKEKIELMAAIWEGSDVIKKHPLVMRDIIESPDRKQAPSHKKRFQAFRIPSFAIRSFATAVALCAIVTGIWFVRPDVNPQKTYATVTGQLSSVFLEDGSMIHLDSETLISTHFTGNFRRIELEQGRAFISVKHEPDRPFIVTSGRTVVRALGTEFNISKEKKGKITVAVTKGSVLVSSNGENFLTDSGKMSDAPVLRPEPAHQVLSRESNAPPSFPHGVVTSGQEITVDEVETVYEIRPVDTEKVNSWRNGKLMFNTEPLADVINEINRYLDNKIVIKDKRLEKITISLNFKLKHRDNFLKTLQMTIPLKYRFTSDGRIALYSKEGART